MLHIHSLKLLIGETPPRTHFILHASLLLTKYNFPGSFLLKNSNSVTIMNLLGRLERIMKRNYK